MASSINASTAGAGGVITTADNSGVLNIQTAGSTAINVTSSQLVNIGTTTSSGQLTVQAASGQGTPLNLLSTDAGSNAQVVFTGNRTYQVGTGNSGSGFSNVLYFYDGTAGAERMRLDTAGLKVGTTVDDPVASRVLGTSIRASSGTYGAIYSRGGGWELGIATTSGNHIFFYTDNGSANVQAGTISSSGSSTTYGTSSDYRLKENVTPIANALESVAKLKPVDYAWKIDSTKGQGFIAHELQEICPQAVTGTKDAIDEEGKPIYQSVDSSFLVATLTAALQELNAKVDAQAAEIAALKAGK